MKRALIVAATGGFLNGFLIPDMKLLQEMGYEVHCAANGNSVSTFVPEERFASIGVTFHQIDFSSTSPVSKESLTAYKQYKELLNRYHFDFVHVHTPIPGAIVRIATRRKRKEGCVVVYTTHGLTFPKGSSLKTKIVYGGVEWFCSWMTDGIITINKEDYAFADKIQLLSDKEARFSMRKACVEKAEEFRLDISHQQMKNIYKNLLREQEKVK